MGRFANKIMAAAEQTAKDAKYANGNSVLIIAWLVWFAVEKRWRTTAVQDAGALSLTPELRKASWSATAERERRRRVRADEGVT